MPTNALAVVPRAPWVRDFALVGALSGALAPAGFFLCTNWRLFDELTPLYPVLTGLGGALAGALLGALSARLMAGRMRRMRRLWLFPLGVLVGGLWGAAAGAAVIAWPPLSDWFALSAIVAAIAGAMQLGWFWFFYCVRRVNHRSTWPVVAVASLASTGLGLAAATVFLRMF